jgi:hypothetical protein
MNEKKDSRPSSLSSTCQGYPGTRANSRIVPSRHLSVLHCLAACGRELRHRACGGECGRVLLWNMAD